MKASRASTLLVILACAGLTVGVWSALNQPIMEPPWPDTLQGIAFSPYQAGQDAVAGEAPTIEQITADLALLSGKTHAVRTYTTEGVFYEIPRLAEMHDLNVAVGAWLDGRLERNQLEIDRAVELSARRNVVRVIVGNEVLLRNELDVDQLIAYLDDARARIARPVSTAETWSTWLKHPELAEHVDFIAVHILPYWEGVHVESAVGFVAEVMNRLKARFPDKPVVIGEVGWPSQGRTRIDAVASASNEALFLRRFFRLAEYEDYIYYVMEAFDQPWKRRIEGSVGAYWGIYDVERQHKFPFNEPIFRVPEWQTLASVSVTVGMMLLSLFFITSYTINTEGKTFMAFIVYGLVTMVAWLVHDYSNQYFTPAGIAVGVVMFSFMLGITALMLFESHEWIEAHWFSHRRRPLTPGSTPSGILPMVSVHVPAYNEPPEMMIETLNALAALDYPDYEVIVIDNNTRDEALWRPVEAHCQTLGARFHFHHVCPLEGYKAGALNYSLRHTSPEASILAYIDSDYVVAPDWLRELVPAFENPDIAIVQAPQDYRDAGESAFKSMCFAEYRGFFHIGMITRNERNAIIQHGTMTMVRKSVMDRLGWSEWCITEDAELGLRVFEEGLQASYTPRSYGRGLMPDTFLDYKKQRYRWAYGAVQILKRHWKSLFLPGRSHLSNGQRYHFVTGWLPWFAEAANLVFGLLAIMWSVGMMYQPEVFEVPLLAFSLLPILFFVFKLLKMFHLYSYRIGSGPGQTLAAAIAGLSLSHTIGKAMLYGLFTSKQPFIRTPKLARRHMLFQAIGAAHEETLMLTAYLLAIATLYNLPKVASPDYTLWLILLAVQSIPYAAALLTSLISASPLPAWLFGTLPQDSKDYPHGTGSSLSH